MDLDPEMNGLPVYTPETLPAPAARRAAMLPAFAASAAAVTVPKGFEIINRTIPGPKDNPTIPVRIYRPPLPGPLPVLLYCHGGGFVIGNLDSEHGRCLDLAQGAGCLVVSVDYRLAPEHPYPGPFEDCYAALLWVAREAAALGGDASRLAVGGLSAGGGLAAALVLASRDRSGPTICFQFLCQPVLDDRLETPSSRMCTQVPVFCRFQQENMWRYYLGPAAGKPAPAYAAPARATSLRGLPPAFVLVAGLDPLRDEGLAYGCRLLAEGITVEMHSFPAVPHGFDVIQPAAAQSRRALTILLDALRAGLAPKRK